MIVAIGGMPGTGKTALMLELMRRMPLLVTFKEGLVQGHHVPCHGVWILGRYGPDLGIFQGTDKLSMSAGPAVEKWALERKEGLILWEGDRLYSGKLFEALQPAHTVTLFELQCAPVQLSKRFERRPETQDTKWLQGRATKIQNLRERFKANQLQNTTPEELSRNAITLLDIVKKFI